GILTERDILNSLGENQDPDSELVSNHRTSDVVFASPDWTLDHAAQTMVAGGFRHLVVVDGGEGAGPLSMRDIRRCRSRTPRRTAARAPRPVRLRVLSKRVGARTNLDTPPPSP